MIATEHFNAAIEAAIKKYPTDSTEPFRVAGLGNIFITHSTIVPPGFEMILKALSPKMYILRKL